MQIKEAASAAAHNACPVERGVRDMSAADPMAGRVVAPTRDPARHADVVIEQAIVAELRRHAWANMASAFVRDHCVLLCGCIADEERRAELVAAVRRVPGVRAVRDRLMVIQASPRVAFAVEGD
jgi:osmotically-inducible protein OsmY